MIHVGLDIGSQYVKTVVLKDRIVVATCVEKLGTGSIETLVFDSYLTALKKAGIAEKEVDYTVATGIGREFITFADIEISELLCSTRGVNWLPPPTGFFLDMGMEKAIVVKNHDGKPFQSFRNDRCASGTGRFLDIAAKPLGLSVEEMGDVSLKSTKVISISSNCAVFAESEIISLIHQKEKIADIVRAIFISMASKVHSLILKMGNVENLTMIGGFAKNVGLVKAIELEAGCQVIVPDTIDPQLVTALGAALIGSENEKTIASM